MSHPTPLLTATIRAEIEAFFPRYPTRQAVVLPALHVVNERLGYVPMQAVVEIAELLGLAPARVQDTLSFYEFFPQDRPHGKYRVWFCRSISCSSREGEELMEYLAERLGIRPGETTADGLVTLEHAECLGLCEQAPAMLVEDVVWGDLTREKLDRFVESLHQNGQPQAHTPSPPAPFPPDTVGGAHPTPNP
jgi:NADH-quinone oxidoreductase subunit E